MRWASVRMTPASPSPPFQHLHLPSCFGSTWKTHRVQFSSPYERRTIPNNSKFSFDRISNSLFPRFSLHSFSMIRRLIFHHSSRNQTQPTSIPIPALKWHHFAWTYSNKTRQSYLYSNGVRQQSFDFGITKFNFESKYARARQSDPILLIRCFIADTIRSGISWSGNTVRNLEGGDIGTTAVG